MHNYVHIIYTMLLACFFFFGRFVYLYNLSLPYAIVFVCVHKLKRMMHTEHRTALVRLSLLHVKCSNVATAAQKTTNRCDHKFSLKMY